MERLNSLSWNILEVPGQLSQVAAGGFKKWPFSASPKDRTAWEYAAEPESVSGPRQSAVRIVTWNQCWSYPQQPKEGAKKVAEMIVTS